MKWVLLCISLMILSTPYVVESQENDCTDIWIDDDDLNDYYCIDTITLNSGSPSLVIKGDYSNVIGSFHWSIENTIQTKGSVELLYNSGIEWNVSFSGNWSEIDPIEDNLQGTLLLHPGSTMELAYEGTLGCSDCISWFNVELELNGTSDAIMSIEHSATGLSQFENIAVPIPILSMYTSIFAIATVSLLMIKRRDNPLSGRSN